MKLRRLEAELFFWGIRLVVLFLFPVYISDVGVYQGDMAKVLEAGMLPYRDFPFEYPPLTFLLLLLPSLAQHAFHLLGQAGYRLVLGLLMLPFDYALFRGILRKTPIPSAGFVYICLTAMLPYLLFDRMDLAVAFFLAAPFLYDKAGFCLSWALGGALKLVPALLLPFRALAEDWSWAKRIGFVTLGFVPIFLSFALAFALSGEASFVAYHQKRGVQIESLVGNFMLVSQALGFFPQVDIQSAFRSQQVVGVPGLWETAKVIFWIATAAPYLFLAWLLLRRKISVLSAAWLQLLGMIAFSYVFSPQYFLWLIPLALLVAAELSGARRDLFLYLFLSCVAITGVHFHYYWIYANRYPPSLYLLMGRNLLTVGLWALSWYWLVIKARAPKELIPEPGLEPG